VTAALWRAGIVANHKRVERVMAELGISGRCGRRKVRTTVRDPNATLASDLVNRDFSAERPDVLWFGDITYVPTGEGWVYVASVLDACTRRLVGWSIADHLRTELVSDALRAAAATRGRVRLDGLIFHSDHGCQYTSDEFRLLSTDLRVTQSMGTVGDSYDCEHDLPAGRCRRRCWPVPSSHGLTRVTTDRSVLAVDLSIMARWRCVLTPADRVGSDPIGAWLCERDP
jgi:hypothetical protein